jgi:hypothetical protein
MSMLVMPCRKLNALKVIGLSRQNGMQVEHQEIEAWMDSLAKDVAVFPFYNRHPLVIKARPSLFLLSRHWQIANSLTFRDTHYSLSDL